MSTTVIQITKLASGKLPDDFLRLQNCLMLLLPIHTKVEYKQALAIAQKLAARKDLTRTQQFYLESLANNIKAYEEKHFPPHKVDPIETLKFLLDENGLNGSDLGRLLNQRQLGSKILNHKRNLSMRHIMILAKHFSVSPALFISE
jgi:HTH-type transcriptional regulator/antitoxin HigA